MKVKSKKHIAIFGIKYFPSRGGTSRVAESLLQHLKEEYRITIYCYAHPNASTNIPGVETITFPEPQIKNAGVFIYFVKCLYHLLTKGNYDLVHVHKTEASYFVPFIRLKYPTIITSHEIPYKNSKWSWFGKIYFHIAEWLFIHSGATRTSISKPQCEYYEHKYGKSVIYISNGVEKPKVAKDSELDAFLEDQHINGEFIFFAARRIIPLKGCHHMINALKRLNYRGQIVVAGDTKQMPQYTTDLILKSKNLNIKFVGYIASPSLLNALVRRSSLFIFPSEIEGMSMMLLEVARLGTPIVCSDIAQNQVILSEDHVLFFKSKDDKDLASKIDYALKHKEEMQRKALEAGRFVSEKYSIESVVQQYIDLYDQHFHPKPTHEYT